MSEAVALELLRFLFIAFPPLAGLLARLLPEDDGEPLAEKVRQMLPLDGASAQARRQLESSDDLSSPDLDEHDDRGPP